MLSFADVFTAPSCLLAGLVITNAVFWPYFAGGSILLIGLVTLRMGERQQGPGFESLLPLGPVFVAVAMAIFGADHLTAAKFVAKIVPSWIPGQLFWAYFVGFALIAAALSLVTRVKWRLAAVLLGIMIFLFVLLIHIPSCFATPFDKTRLTIVLRDSALSAGI